MFEAIPRIRLNLKFIITVTFIFNTPWNLISIYNWTIKRIQIEHNFSPFPPSVPIWHRLAKLSILISEGIIKKISYDRRDYESVDEKILS